MSKLYDITKGSKLRVQKEGEDKMRDATFHHLDGMYSFCTLDGVDGDKGIFHLHVMQELKLVDGKYECV